MILDPPPLKTCSRCAHWYREATTPSEGPGTNSSVDGVCQEHLIESKHKYTRSSHTCSHWMRTP